MTSKSRKITQREIARIAGVSQTTVSTVLNDREGSNVRIPAATRARVKEAIERLAYVADPAARRLAGLDNQIIGVFTYEPALSPESMDFYGPLLNGIERSAETLGCDLLFFTSSPVQDGRRKLFHRRTRLGLADGCILLGQEMDGADLDRLVDERFPFVAVGRRDETDARVPYVGIDYAAPTVDLIDRAVGLGHERAVYVHRGRETATARDRREAVQSPAATRRIRTTLVTDEDLTAVAGAVRDAGATLVLAEDAFLAEDVVHVLRTEGFDVPNAVSVAALAEVRGHRTGERALTGFHVRRRQVAAEALALLQHLITTAPEEWDTLDVQRLLSADLEAGETVVERRPA